MRRWRPIFVLILALTTPLGDAVAQGPTAQLAEFPTAETAQRHCPRDTVVWLNLPTGIYHFAGERWFGRTRSGAYVCQREAARAGMRATRNGQ